MIANKYSNDEKKQAKPKRPGYITLFMNRASKSALQGLDLLAKVSTIMQPDLFLEKIGKIASEGLLKELEDNPITKKGENLGLYRDYIPEGYKEKFVSNLGDITGSILTSGPIGALRNPRTIAQTVGGMVSQAGLEPIIHEKLKNYPKIQAGANILSGLMGSSVSGALANKTLGKELPHATSAMKAPLESVRSDELIRKSLDLAKRDKKYGRQLHQIVRNRQNSFEEALKPKENLKGSEIVEYIIESFDSKRQKMMDAYEDSTNGLLENFKGRINLSKVDHLIMDLKKNAAEGSKTMAAIEKAEHLIMLNRHDPVKLNKAKSDIQAMTEGLGKLELHLSNAQAKNISDIGHELKEAISDAVPAIIPINKAYEESKKQLSRLQNGVVGKSVQKALDEPSKIFERIFKKTDKEKIHEFKEVIPEKLYNAAADHYVYDILQKNLGEPSKNQKNLTNNWFKVRSAFQRQKDQLKATLPEETFNKVMGVVEDIKQTERGVPVNDYLNKIGREIAVGDETKGLGVLKSLGAHAVLPGIGGLAGGLYNGWEGALEGASAGLALDQFGRPIKKRMIRNELLTGKTPTQQLLNKPLQIAEKALPQSILARNIGSQPVKVEEERVIKPHEEEIKITAKPLQKENQSSMSLEDYEKSLWKPKESSSVETKSEKENTKSKSVSMEDFEKSLWKNQEESKRPSKKYHYHPLLKFNSNGVGSNQKKG